MHRETEIHNAHEDVLLTCHVFMKLMYIGSDEPVSVRNFDDDDEDEGSISDSSTDTEEEEQPNHQHEP